MYALLGIKKTRMTAFRPFSNCLVERYNRTLNEILCATTDEYPMTWDERIPILTMANGNTE